jgi:Tol biopolymer transport system component
MTTRRLLWVTISALSAVIVLAGAGVAALLFFQLGRPAERLLVIGDTSLTLLDQGGKGRVLADDSNRDFRYPTLSPDGTRVAYIAQNSDGPTLSVVQLSSGERKVLYRSSDSQPFYMTWSPDGKHISFLSGQSDGTLSVRIVAADGSQAPDLVRMAASSSYFAWKPDSSALLLHSDGASFQDGRVTAYQPGSSRPIMELADPGLFKTPAWSVDGTQFFYVAQPAVQGSPTPDMVESVLTRVSADGAVHALASEKQAELLFARAPSSDYIAYTTVTAAGYGPLKLVDAAGGAPTIISRRGEQVPAFFWAPDGTRLAYLTFERLQDGSLHLTWHVVDRGGGSVHDLSSFVPSKGFMALLTYFDAYAFSFGLWSSRGDKLVYGADDGVYVLEVSSGKAERRADGIMATWVGQR